ncbi:choice-of-anchor U domain-containing protein [Desulfobacterales bacterium HSG16]|nr:choice-of-anchor U domain-containing protein [Desulfobacterales bacterium HSG16]
MKKYFIPLLLSIILCAANSFALSVSISPQSTDLSTVGNSFQVDVYIENVTDLGGFQFDILYDPAIVQIQAQDDVTLGSFLESTGATGSPLGPVIDNSAGKLTFGAFAFGQNTGAEGSGILASVTFTVKAVKDGILNLDKIQLAAITDGSSLTPELIGDAVLFDGTEDPDPVVPDPVEPDPVEPDPVEPDPIQPATYQVSFTAQENGTLEGNMEQNVEQGSNTSQVTGVPDEGYRFTGWTGDYTGTENPLTLADIKTDMTVTASFKAETVITPETYRVIYSTSGNGSIEGDMEQIVEEAGDTTNVTAVPDEGYNFDRWTGDYIGTENPLSMTDVNSDMNITADFTEKIYTIKVTKQTGGSITPADNVTVTHGKNAEYTITPDTDHHIENVLIDNESVGVVSTWLFETITADHTITALFAADEPSGNTDNGDDSSTESPDDKIQIATLLSATGTGNITVDISSTPENWLTEVQALSDTDPNLNQSDKPKNMEFKDGLAAFKVNGIESGQSVQVKITFPSGIPEDAICFKTDDDGFYEYTEVLYEENAITLTLFDGGIGDDDGIENGIITDAAAGIAVPTKEETDSDDSDSGPCFIGSLY